MKIDEILDKYQGRAELIDALEEIQENEGYISEEAMHLIEEKMGIPIVEITGVVTFYSAFTLKPSGKHKIKVCTGTACHVKRSENIKEHLQEVLKVKEGETTKDGVFTLECVNCIGACAKAPAIMIDDKVFGELDESAIDEIINRYR